MAKETKSVVVTNRSDSPRGVNAVSGTITLQPGQKSGEIVVYEGELVSMRMGSELQVKVVGEPFGGEGDHDDDGSGDKGWADFLHEKDEALGLAFDKLTEAERLSAEKDTTISDLRDQFRERGDELTSWKQRTTELAGLKSATALKAEHHGGGKFNITRGEDVLAKGLSKADADAFNAMTDAEKAEYVATAKKAE